MRAWYRGSDALNHWPSSPDTLTCTKDQYYNGVAARCEDVVNVTLYSLHIVGSARVDVLYVAGSGSDVDAKVKGLLDQGYTAEPVPFKVLAPLPCSSLPCANAHEGQDGTLALFELVTPTQVHGLVALTTVLASLSKGFQVDGMTMRLITYDIGQNEVYQFNNASESASRLATEAEVNSHPPGWVNISALGQVIPK